MSSRAVSLRKPALDGLAPAAALLGVAAACWVVTAQRMQGMDMGPGTDLGALGWFLVVWATMMAAMMLPSLAPRATVLLAAGYLFPWVAAGALAYGAIDGIRTLDVGVLQWGEAGPYVAGAVIAAAALYELTAAKATCLRRCRRPAVRAPGAANALRAGVAQGVWCIGCCWALMAALFAVGVMSLTWMIVVAALIAVEKLAPWEDATRWAVAGLLLALAAGVAFDPAQVPGLTIPM
jgi:predicted metal-binding membrane protein